MKYNDGDVYETVAEFWCDQDEFWHPGKYRMDKHGHYYRKGDTDYGIKRTEIIRVVEMPKGLQSRIIYRQEFQDPDGGVSMQPRIKMISVGSFQHKANYSCPCPQNAGWKPAVKVAPE